MSSKIVKGNIKWSKLFICNSMLKHIVHPNLLKVGLNLRNSFLFKYFNTFSFVFLPFLFAGYVSYKDLNQYFSLKIFKSINKSSLIVIQENYLEIINNLFSYNTQKINGSINHVVLCWVVNHMGCYNSPFDATMGCGLLSVLEMIFVSSQLPTGNINKNSVY